MTDRTNNADFRQAATAHAFIRLMKEAGVTRKVVGNVCEAFVQGWKLDESWVKDLAQMVEEQFTDSRYQQRAEHAGTEQQCAGILDEGGV